MSTSTFAGVISGGRESLIDEEGGNMFLTSVDVVVIGEGA